MMRANSAVLWNGPSQIDGAPIVLIAANLTLQDSNSKTGPMVQTYILRADVPPVQAARERLDVSICGDCPLRAQGEGLSERGCYVNIGQGAGSVWRAFDRGRYPRMRPEEAGRDRKVRLGTYGDPAAVPLDIWRALLSHATGHTGYTHQWRQAPEYLQILMGSADSLDDVDAIEALGGRAFHVRPKNAPRPIGFTQCPAAKEAPTHGRVKCATCLLCDGSSPGRRGQRRRHLSIEAHGSGAKHI